MFYTYFRAIMTQVAGSHICTLAESTNNYIIKLLCKPYL